MDVETEIGMWVFDYLMRQPQSKISDQTLNSLLKILPLPNNNLNPNLTTLLLLRTILTHISKGTVSEDILDLLEFLEEHYHLTDVPVTDSMRQAYCHVAVKCTVDDKAIKKIWKGRVGRMMGKCGLVSDDLLRLRDDGEREEWTKRGEDAVGAVRVCVAEGWERLGPSFLEVVVGRDDVVDELLRVGEEDENSRIPVVNKEVVSQNGTMLPRRKHVAKKRSRGSVAGTSIGAKITNTEEVENRDLLNRYGCLPIPAIDKVQEALTASSLELHAVVNDPLPEALQLAENIISSKNTDGRTLEVQGNKADPKRLSANHQNNNATKPSLMTRNPTACTFEWVDSVDDLHEGGSDSRSTVKLASPKNRVVSPLKKHEMKNLTGRRRIKKWSMLEEETLKTGVEKYGKGCWKAILNSYPDIFEDRTEVDLKDKWRNLTRYSH